MLRFATQLVVIETVLSFIYFNVQTNSVKTIRVWGQKKEVIYSLTEDIVNDETFNRDLVVATMTELADVGLTSFEAGELNFESTQREFESQEMGLPPNFIHTAEDYIGSFCAGPLSHPLLSKQSRFMTTWSPDVDSFAEKCNLRVSITREEAERDIASIIKRMNSEQLNLVKLHWSDCENKFFFYAMDHLMNLQGRGMIDQLGLYGFGADSMNALLVEDAPVTSNQVLSVSLSLIATHPLRNLTTAAETGKVQLLCHETLQGGFLTSYWLGKPEPHFAEQSSSSNNAGGGGGGRYKEMSLLRHLRAIQRWGGWPLFQDLLTVLNIIADKHSSSSSCSSDGSTGRKGINIGTVAQRWVLDQKAVAGIVTSISERGMVERICRANVKEYAAESMRVVELRLDPEDHLAIAAVLSRSKSYCGATSSKVRPRILDIVMSAFSEKTFSVCILSALSGFAHNDLHDGVSFYYKVPENLCRTHIVNGVAQESRFAAGAIMAVFDEVSTYATTMKDKTHRPGLSVHLSTEILQNVYAGEEVTVLTQADKLGKSIGFCSMELLNKKGELVARGKHIRFLQMGMPFDLIAHRWMLPWTITYYENFHGRKEDLPSTTGGQGKHIFKLPAGFPSLDGTGRIFDVLGLNRTEHIKYGTDLHNKSATHCSDNGRIDPDKEQQFGMTVLPVTSNLLGNMHGGAVACAVEHACVLARTRAPIMLSGSSSIGKNADNINSSTSSTSNNSSSEGSVVGAGQGEYLLECCVTGVEVRYINAMKGDLVITTVEDIYAPPLPRPDSLGVTWSSKSFGKVLSRDGTVCAEYVCSWAMC